MEILNDHFLVLREKFLHLPNPIWLSIKNYSNLTHVANDDPTTERPNWKLLLVNLTKKFLRLNFITHVANDDPTTERPNWKLLLVNLTSYEFLVPKENLEIL